MIACLIIGLTVAFCFVVVIASCVAKHKADVRESQSHFTPPELSDCANHNPDFLK